MTRKLIILAILLLVSANGFAQSYSRVNPDSIPFAPPVTYQVPGNFFWGLFCADLDGDLDMDLVVTHLWYPSGVSVLLNNGDGTFQGAVYYAAGDAPIGVFCADLDGDIDIDLAVANNNSNDVSILKNNGDGTFQNAVSYYTGGYPNAVFCADLDGDSDLDMAVTSNGGSISILLNNGDGTFQGPAIYPVGSGTFGVFCADLDNDLDQDVVFGNGSSNRICIFYNNGDATFGNGVYYEPGGDPVFCGDMDGDLDLDIVVGGGFIYKNNGDGTFQNGVDYMSGSANSVMPFSAYLSLADLDGDIDLDLVTGGDHISILQNNGDATFGNHIDYSVGAVRIFCADLDGDLDLDLAVSGGWEGDAICVLMNLTQLPGNSHPYPFRLLSPADSDIRSTVVVDFDWATTYDVNLSDQIRYDLYLSTVSDFNQAFTIVYDSLILSQLTDTLDIGKYYWKVKAYDNWGAVRWSDQTWSFYVYLRGDCNGDGQITVADVVYAINYLFKGGPPPIPLKAGDANCDGKVTVADVVYLINYLFKGGPPPPC